MKTVTCTVCPNGCRISCDKSGDEYLFSGNRCKRGAAYAQSELTVPMRTLCTTVHTSFAEAPALPVRTNMPIPKERIQDVMQALRGVCVSEPLKLGDAVVPDVLGLKSDIIVTSTILENIERSC